VIFMPSTSITPKPRIPVPGSIPIILMYLSIG
jgi:hypothetical protein